MVTNKNQLCVSIFRALFRYTFFAFNFKNDALFFPEPQAPATQHVHNRSVGIMTGVSIGTASATELPKHIRVASAGNGDIVRE